MLLDDGNYVFFHNSWGGKGECVSIVGAVMRISFWRGGGWVVSGGVARGVLLLVCKISPALTLPHPLHYGISKGVPPPGYQPAWVILNGTDPTHILARAPKSLWTPTDQPWMEGKAPYTCNVPEVAFLEAAHPAGNNSYRVYFGGADAVLGTALVGFERVPGVVCESVVPKKLQAPPPCEWPSGTHFHYAHAGRAGLNDRTHVLNVLTNLAATVNGTLCFPPPCESLVSYHNGGRAVPCGPGERWDDYTTIWPPTLPPGGEHQPLQVPVPPDSLWGCDGHWGSSLPVETGGPGQLGRRAVAVPNYYTWKCLVAVENLPRVVRVAYKTAPAVQLLRSLRITAKEQSSLLTANPEQPYEAYTPAGMPYYLLHIRRGNALKFQQHPDELIALNRTQTRFSQLEVDSVVQAVIGHYANHFKARFKGVATVTETATKLTLLFCTDETNTTYLAELVQRLRAIPWVERAIHLDPLLSKTQPNNYKVYAIEQALYRMQDSSRVQKLRRGDPGPEITYQERKKIKNALRCSKNPVRCSSEKRTEKESIKVAKKAKAAAATGGAGGAGGAAGAAGIAE